MSGVDFDGASIRKGAVDSIMRCQGGSSTVGAMPSRAQAALRARQSPMPCARRR